MKFLSFSNSDSKKRVVLKSPTDVGAAASSERLERGDSKRRLKNSVPDANQLPSPRRKPLVPIPKPPEDLVRKPTTLTFEGLPEKIKMKCMESDIPLQQYQDDIELLYACAKFIHGADFGVSKVESRTTGKITCYASDELLEFGKKQVTYHPKPLKKLFSSGVETGSGGYGKVYNCMDKQLKQEVAVKKLRHDCDKRRINNYSEIAFLASCDHPNIVKFLKAYYSPAGKKNIEECWVIMEFLHGGTLREAVKIHKMSVQHAAFISREILKGIEYIHSHGWAHRDLKSSNVMLSLTGEIKLVDLGLCCEVTCENALERQVGSPYWMAPEILRDGKHSNKCDIWSAGVICLEMITGQAPHYPRALQAAFLAATVGFYHLFPPDAPEEILEYLKATLHPDPEKRSPASTLLQMNWFKTKGIDKGVQDIFREIFLANRLNVMAISAFG